MRAPLSWLKAFTPLAAEARHPDSLQELSESLDSLGLVVAGIEHVGEGLDEVVLSQVLEISPIDGADRIRRVLVDTGDGRTTDVVCGAWNFEVGDVVPFIRAGGELPGGIRIEKRKMRGVTSNGMLCSPAELGLAGDRAGLMIVARPGAGQPPGLDLGLAMSEHLGIGHDAVFDLEVEANRPDCLSMSGIARDLAAHYGLPFEVPEQDVRFSPGSSPAGDLGSVRVETPELCLRLTARVMRGVAVVPSPAYVQRRLTLMGMRPINCVVDASNYVMLELGQPTHPYDIEQLGGRGLVARAAHRGESIVTLDGETRFLGTRPVRGSDELTSLDCLICNANDVPVGIGGVIGGQASEISDRTTSVLLEAALFLPVAVARTSRSVNLRTEASLRFERGVDPEGVERASLRVCQLVAEAAAAAGLPAPELAPGLLDDAPATFARARVIVRPERVNALLGTDIGAEQMAGLLGPIGYLVAPPAEGVATSSGDAGAFEAVVPSWRPDVSREVDVIEDIARMFGYRKIPPTERRSPYVGRLDEVQLLRRRLRRVLAGLGAHEAWTSSIVSPADQARAGLSEDLVRLSNPMVAEESVLRAGLMAGLMAALRHNSGHRRPWLRLFEVGDVFSLVPLLAGNGREELLLPDERERLALVLALEDDDASSAVHAWRVVQDALGIVGVAIEQGDPEESSRGALAGLHLARSARICMPSPEAGGADGGAGNGSPAGDGSPGGGASAESILVGTVGEVDLDVVAAFGLPHRRIGWLELNVNRLASAPRRPVVVAPVSRYPSSDVDLAFVVDESVPSYRVEETLRQAATALCESIELFDVYRGTGVPDGRRSLAFRLRFCALDHTLNDAEVASLRRRCIDAVEGALPATLRG